MVYSWYVKVAEKIGPDQVCPPLFPIPSFCPVFHCQRGVWIPNQTSWVQSTRNLGQALMKWMGALQEHIAAFGQLIDPRNAISDLIFKWELVTPGPQAAQVGQQWLLFQKRVSFLSL